MCAYCVAIILFFSSDTNFGLMGARSGSGPCLSMLVSQLQLLACVAQISLAPHSLLVVLGKLHGWVTFGFRHLEKKIRPVTWSDLLEAIFILNYPINKPWKSPNYSTRGQIYTVACIYSIFHAPLSCSVGVMS